MIDVARIVKARKMRNLTQTQLGDLVGKKHTTICLIEKGKIKLSLKTLTKLTEALGLPEHVLFTSVSEQDFNRSLLGE